LGVHELSPGIHCTAECDCERYNGVLQSIARAIHLESKLTKSFGLYAFLAACYLRNRLPNQGEKTPYELLREAMSLLRVFGCPCYVTLVNGKKRNKLDERDLSGRLVDTSASKGYFVWVPVLRQVVESRDSSMNSLIITVFLGCSDGSSYSPATITDKCPETA
jgi:hypothetical protein